MPAKRDHTADKLLEDFERMTFYVHRSEGRVVGVVALYIENEEAGRVRWVFVLPEYQRRGIGTALVTHVERRAREPGLRRLRLATPAKAGWALRFYGKLGYEPAGEIENPLLSASRRIGQSLAPNGAHVVVLQTRNCGIIGLVRSAIPVTST